MKGYHDYEDFRPIEYLYEFYLKENNDNIFLLDFIINSVYYIKEKYKEKKEILELSGGPSLLPLFSLIQIANNIDFSDNLDINLNVVKDWINKKQIFNWDFWVEKTLELEYKKQEYNSFISPRLIEHRKEIVRRKWRNLKKIDLKSLHLRFYPYDIVSCHFVPECITNSLYEFLFVFQNILSFISENGYFIASFFYEAKSLKVGSSIYPTIYLNKDYILNLLSNFNFKIINYNYNTSNLRNGYKGILCVLAKKNKKHNYYTFPKNESFFLSLSFFSKKRNLYFKGILERDFLLYLKYYKIFYKYNSYLYNELCLEKIKAYVDDFNIYLSKEQYNYLNRYEFIFNDINNNIIQYDIDILKNKSYFLNKYILEILNKYPFIKYTDCMFFLKLKKEKVENLNQNLIQILSRYLNFIYYDKKNNLFIILLKSIKKLQEIKNIFNLYKELEVLDLLDRTKDIDYYFNKTLVIKINSQNLNYFYYPHILSVHQKENFIEFYNLKEIIKNNNDINS